MERERERERGFVIMCPARCPIPINCLVSLGRILGTITLHMEQ